MSNAVAFPRTGFKFVMTVRDGPDLGAVFQLLPPRVTIGRGVDNHVSVQDPRMSRHAAVIEFSLEQITIKDLSGRESMMVNGYTLKESVLNDGDLIMFGETELKFTVEALPLESLTPAIATKARIHPTSYNKQATPTFNTTAPASRWMRKRKRNSGST